MSLVNRPSTSRSRPVLPSHLKQQRIERKPAVVSNELFSRDKKDPKREVVVVVDLINFRRPPPSSSQTLTSSFLHFTM